MNLHMYKNKSKTMMWADIIYPYFCVAQMQTITWSKHVCSLCDSSKDSWIRVLLALVWFKLSTSSPLSRMLPWAVARV